MHTFKHPKKLRAAIRKGEYRHHTSGCAPGYVQCNIVILPFKWANDFELFCQRNPKACPLLAKSQVPGDYYLPMLGNIDIRTDVPSYQVFHHGLPQTQVHDISDLWQEDFVTFALGCSFSFEEALLDAGLEVRNISESANVPMFRTCIDCEPAGEFSGKLVVSMRPFKALDAIQAIEISASFPKVHGSPVHLGDPQLIGIDDLSSPDFGDTVTVKPDELPVFWACGVTPQLALKAAKVPFAITHSPGCMLVTDVRNTLLAT